MSKRRFPQPAGLRPRTGPGAASPFSPREGHAASAPGRPGAPPALPARRRGMALPDCVKEGMGEPSRREFLKNLSIGLAGATIFGSEKAHAQKDDDWPYDLSIKRMGRYAQNDKFKKILPPGIFYCRDGAIRIIYLDVIEHIWGGDFGRISYRMNSEMDGYYDSIIVKPWSRDIEPAWYMLREQIDYKFRNDGYNSTVSRKSSDVPQMKAFDEGLARLFTVHFRSYWGGYSHTYSEKNLERMERSLNLSISYAAYDSESEAERKAQEYVDADIDGKRRIAIDIKNRLDAMGDGSRESKDPRNPYNRRLVAAWAIFVLAIHYRLSRRHRRGDDTPGAFGRMVKLGDADGDLVKRFRALEDMIIDVLQRNNVERWIGHAITGPPPFKYLWGQT